MNRYPVPNNKPPKPNGYDDFLAARELMPLVRLIDDDKFDPWEAEEAELRQVSDELALALQKVDEGLTKPTWLSVDFFDPEYPRRTSRRLSLAPVGHLHARQAGRNPRRL